MSRDKNTTQYEGSSRGYFGKLSKKFLPHVLAVSYLANGLFGQSVPSVKPGDYTVAKPSPGYSVEARKQFVQRMGDPQYVERAEKKLVADNSGKRDETFGVLRGDSVERIPGKKKANLDQEVISSRVFAYNKGKPITVSDEIGRYQTSFKNFGVGDSLPNEGENGFRHYGPKSHKSTYIFQSDWNKAFPDNKIGVDGDLGIETKRAVYALEHDSAKLERFKSARKVETSKPKIVKETVAPKATKLEEKVKTGIDTPSEKWTYHSSVAGVSAEDIYTTRLVLSETGYVGTDDKPLPLNASKGSYSYGPETRIGITFLKNFYREATLDHSVNVDSALDDNARRIIHFLSQNSNALAAAKDYVSRFGSKLRPDSNRYPARVEGFPYLSELPLPTEKDKSEPKFRETKLPKVSSTKAEGNKAYDFSVSILDPNLDLLGTQEKWEQTLAQIREDIQDSSQRMVLLEVDAEEVGQEYDVTLPSVDNLIERWNLALQQVRRGSLEDRTTTVERKDSKEIKYVKSDLPIFKGTVISEEPIGYHGDNPVYRVKDPAVLSRQEIVSFDLVKLPYETTQGFPVYLSPDAVDEFDRALEIATEKGDKLVVLAAYRSSVYSRDDVKSHDGVKASFGGGQHSTGRAIDAHFSGNGNSRSLLAQAGFVQSVNGHRGHYGLRGEKPNLFNSTHVVRTAESKSKKVADAKAKSSPVVFTDNKPFVMKLRASAQRAAEKGLTARNCYEFVDDYILQPNGATFLNTYWKPGYAGKVWSSGQVPKGKSWTVLNNNVKGPKESTIKKDRIVDYVNERGPHTVWIKECLGDDKYRVVNDRMDGLGGREEVRTISMSKVLAIRMPVPKQTLLAKK